MAEEKNNSELAKALNQFQSKAPVIEKRKTAKIPTKNGSSYEYKYADLADIWAKIRKPLTECGLMVIQMPTTLNGDHALKTIVMHSSGEKLQDTMRLPVEREASPQALGSAITYAKRYMLGAALGLVTEDDDDARQLQLVTQEEIYLLKKAAFKTGITTAQQFEDLIYQLTGKPSKRIPTNDFDAVMKQIEEMGAEQANG